MNINEYALLFCGLFAGAAFIGWCRFVVDQRSMQCPRQFAACSLSGGCGVICAIAARFAYHLQADSPSTEQQILWMMGAALIGGFLQLELSKTLKASTGKILTHIALVFGVDLDKD